MLEAVTALILVIATGNVASTAVAEAHSESQVELHADTAREGTAERIARMRARMRSRQPRTSRVRCAHVSCGPTCETKSADREQSTLIAHSAASTANNRATAQPSACEQSAA